MNVILRPTILYACETYFNLKESEIRQIERIEESYIRQVFKTTRGCPIAQLYLEIGQIPARFEIKKMRLLFLHYILQQNTDSLISKFLYLQLESPVKGDWASSCLTDLKELEINKSFEEIKLLTRKEFSKTLKNHIKSKLLKMVYIFHGWRKMIFVLLCSFFFGHH